MDFTGKVAIVTGSGRGIGKAIAMKLAENGATLVINDVGDSAPAEQTVTEIKNLNRRAMATKKAVSWEFFLVGTSRQPCDVMWGGRIGPLPLLRLGADARDRQPLA